jgi:nucleoid DNA-binding protein
MKKLRLDIIEDLARQFPALTENDVRPLVNQLITNLKDYLIKGHTIHLSEFGNFKVSIHKPKRVALNGAVITTPTRRSAKFHISRYFRDELNNGKGGTS